VVLLALVVFLPSLGYDFVWDDILLVRNNQFLQPHNSPSSFLGKDFTELTFGSLPGHFYRPLFALSLWADGVVWGQQPAGFHGTTLFFHGLVVGLLWLVVTRLSDPLTATLASVLFAVHPAHSEVAVFISGRVDSLALVPMLAGLWCFLELNRCRSIRGRVMLHLGVLGAFVLALAAKESAAVLPGLLLAVGLHDPAAAGRRLAGRLWVSLARVTGVLVIAGIYAVWRWSMLTGHAAQAVSSTSAANRVWITLGAFGSYTVQALLPVPLGPERYPGIPHAPWDPLVLLGWVSLLGVAFWLRWGWSHRPMAAVGLLWYLVALAPVLAVVPVNAAGEFVLAERWLYAPSVGMMLALAATAQPWLVQAGNAARVRFAWGGLLAWSVAGLGALLWITPIWESNETFYRYVLARNPGAPGPVMNVGILELKAGRPEVAVGLLRQAVAGAPRDPPAWMNLGWALRELKHHDEALAAFRESIRLNPAWVLPPILMGSVYYDTGRYAEGTALLQSVVKRAPTFALGYKFLGEFYRAAGRLNDAVAAYREAVRLNPRDRDAFRLLARTQVGMGVPQAAVATLEKGLVILSGDPLLQAELAELHDATGHTWKARALWEAVASQSVDLELSRFAAARLAQKRPGSVTE
jgi:predicted Zn-dependent protease